MELIQNNNNTLPQQVEENRKNILIIGDSIFIVTDKGQWSNNYTYKRGDLVYVTSNGVDYSFVCVQQNLNIEPLVNQNYLQYWRRWGGVDGVTPIINAQAVSVPYTQEASVEKTGDQYNMTYTFYIPRGNTGATPQFAIGTITTLPAGSQATVTITGTTDNPILNFGIPIGNKGDKGDTGDTGATPQFSIGSVTAGGYNQAEVNISGTPESPILNFILPRGEKGDTGNTPVIAIGTVTTLLPSQQAYVNITGTADYPILNFGIPRGESGINSGTIHDEGVMGDSTSTYSTAFLNTYMGQFSSALQGILDGTTTVPNASHASTADSATNATNATNAVNATLATSASTAQDAVNVMSTIDGVALTSIFESNKTTVKNATNATNATNAEKTSFTNGEWNESTNIGNYQVPLSSINNRLLLIYFESGYAKITQIVKMPDISYYSSALPYNNSLISLYNSIDNGPYKEYTYAIHAFPIDNSNNANFEIIISKYDTYGDTPTTVSSVMEPSIIQFKTIK